MSFLKLCPSHFSIPSEGDQMGRMVKEVGVEGVQGAASGSRVVLKQSKAARFDQCPCFCNAPLGETGASLRPSTQTTPRENLEDFWPEELFEKYEFNNHVRLTQIWALVLGWMEAVEQLIWSVSLKSKLNTIIS